MKRITKEMCTVFIKDHYKSKTWYPLWILSVVDFFLWYKFKDVTVTVISVAVSLIIFTLIVLIAVNKIKSITPKDFYLVEDQVVSYKKRRSIGKYNSGYRNIYTFKNYGKHTLHTSSPLRINISFRKGKDTDTSYINEMAALSNDKGDLFYLLIYENNGKVKIIKAFPKSHFDIDHDNFELFGSKYYSKR